MKEKRGGIFVKNIFAFNDIGEIQRVKDHIPRVLPTHIWKNLMGISFITK